MLASSHKPQFTQPKSNYSAELRDTEIDYLVKSFLEILGLSLDDLTVNDVLLKAAMHGHLPCSFNSGSAKKLYTEKRRRNKNYHQ